MDFELKESQVQRTRKNGCVWIGGSFGKALCPDSVGILGNLRKK